MDKVAMYKEEIYKKAASFDAQRNKQYWQLLKRLYGGTKGAVENLNKTKDFNIYHGTMEPLLGDIANQGLNSGGYREFGKGLFFGDKQTAGYYSRPKVVDASRYEDFIKNHKKTPISYGSVNGFYPENASEDQVRDFIKNNPEYAAIYGKNIRLATPSELHGTRVKYPNLNDAMVFDINDRGFSSAGSQLEYKMTDDPALELRRKYQKQIKNMSTDEVKSELTNLYRHNFGWDDAKIKSTIASFDDYNNSSRYFLDTDLADMRVRKIITNRFRPNNKSEFNKMKYYGQSRRGRMFDGIIAHKGKRNEFFFKKDNISPELLRTEDGKPMAKKIESTEPKPNMQENNERNNNTTNKKSNNLKYLAIPAAIGGTMLVGNVIHSIKKKRIDDRKTDIMSLKKVGE